MADSVVFECNVGPQNIIDNGTDSEIFVCPPNKYCLYCCCNPQCCLVVPRRSARQIWEAWYFWLGIALLALLIVTSVSSYLFTNCRQKFYTSSFGRNLQSMDGNRQNNPANRNEVSINIIATPGPRPSHTKMLLVAPRASLTHMTPIVA